MLNKKVFILSAALIAFLGLNQSQLLAQQSQSPTTGTAGPSQVLGDLPGKCHSYFTQWAKSHPEAARELERRHQMHDSWVSKYPDANNDLRQMNKSIRDWAIANPAREREIQEFRVQCRKLMK